MNLPGAYKEGWVNVKVNGKSDKTGKSSYLGKTEIFYFNEYKEDLKQIVQNQELLVTLFETWKTACEGYPIDSIETQTKSFSSGRHKRPLDILHQSQVNVEYVIKNVEDLCRGLLESI